MMSDIAIVGFQFSEGGTPAVGARDTRRALSIAGQAGGERLRRESARVLSAKMLLRVDSSLIVLWRADLEGNSNASAEPPEASPLFAGAFEPPDTFNSAIFITGYSLGTAFQWEAPPAGMSQVMEFQPLNGRDTSRIVGCNSTLRFNLREFGPGASLGFTAWVWLKLQWGCDCE